MQHLILKGPYKFELNEFVDFLSGGVLTFIGDSVSAQAFWSILYRFEFSRQYTVEKCLVSTHELVRYHVHDVFASLSSVALLTGVRHVRPHGVFHVDTVVLYL